MLIIHYMSANPLTFFSPHLQRRDWTVIPPYYDELIAKYVTPGNCEGLTVILSAEHIYNYDADYCPGDIETFHLYRNPCKFQISNNFFYFTFLI